MFRENVRDVEPWLIPFPEPAVVFAEPADRYARLLSPLVSIDLAAVRPEWHGWAHLVSPIEPTEGCLGDGTEAHHSYYARANWLGLRLDDDDHYHLLADWRYFQAESDDATVRDDPELVDWYRRQQDSYDAARALFRRHGRLLDPRHPDAGSYPFLAQVGGTAGPGGNWAQFDDFPLRRTDSADGEPAAVPIAENGDLFHFVAAVPGWNYRDSGAGWILMFFEPNSRTALFTFDWS